MFWNLFYSINWTLVIGMLFSLINILFAGFLLLETKKLREAETEPEISIYLQQNQRIESIFDIVVKNIGKGPAYILSFDFDKGAELIQAQEFRKLHELGFFQGVNYLAPNQEYKSIFGGLKLLKETPWKPLEIEVKYKNKKNKIYYNKYYIDPADYFGTEQIRSKTIDDISKDLKKIAETLQEISKHIKKINGYSLF